MMPEENGLNAGGHGGKQDREYPHGITPSAFFKPAMSTESDSLFDTLSGILVGRGSLLSERFAFAGESGAGVAVAMPGEKR